MAKQTKTTSKVVANTTIGGTPAIAAASLVGKVVAPQVKKIDEELLQAAGDVQAEQVVAVDAAPASVGFELAQAAGAAAGSTGAAAGAGAGAAGMSIGTIAAIGAGVAVAANASKSSSSTTAAAATTPTTPTTPAVVAGQTFTLTTGVDKGTAFTGGTTDDTFTAALLTLNAGDEIDGGTGTDTLNAEINADIGATTKLTSVENINITGYGARAIDLTGVSGAKVLTAKLSTGAITLNNNNDATMALGFEGGLTNNITSNYKAGALDGASDTLNLKLNGATAVTAVATAGFEKVAIDNAGTSSLTAVTAPGVDVATVTGSGTLNIAATLDGMKTLTATAFTGSLRTGTVDATTGLPSTTFTGNTAGSTVLLGSGDDVFGFAQGAGTATGTLKAGAGNDTIVLNAQSTGGAFVFGEAGDDKVRVVTSALTTDDIIDGGDGNDTVQLAVAGANSLVLKSVENLALTSAATGAITVTASDKALTVTAGANNGNAINLNDLTAGSTVAVASEAAATTKTAGAVTVKFKAAEAASTLDIKSGMTGILTTDKITAATVNLGAASDIGGAYAFNSAQSVTINATGALSATTGQNVVDATATDTLKTFTASGTDVVKFGTITATTLTDVSVTAAKALTVGLIGGDATGLTNVTLTSTTDAITGNGIGLSTATGTLNVTATSAKAMSTGALIGTKFGNVSLTNTAAATADGGVTVGAVGADATTFGNMTITAKGDIVTGLIGNTTPSITSIGTIAMTSASGKVDFDDIDLKDAGGIDVNLSAATFIDKDGAGAAAYVKNTGGVTNASLAGAAAAAVNFTGTTVQLTATNTGGLTSTITEAGTAAAGQVSNITLGNAASGKANAITVGGVVDTINITGGTGKDTVAFSTANTLKGGTIALGGGSLDAIDFTNIAHANGSAASKGIAVNLSGTGVDFDSGTANASSLAGFTAAAYDAAAAKAIIASGVSFTVTGAEVITGTAQADYFVAANTGSTFKGAGGADKIYLGAASDTVIFDNVSTIDSVYNFTAGASKDVLSVSVAGIAAAKAAATTNASVAAGDAVAIQELSAAATQGAGKDVFVLTGATYATAALAEAAIEAGGGRAITALGATVVGQKYIIVWSDGTDSHVGSWAAGSVTAAGAALATGDGALTEFATIKGVNASVAGTLDSTNFTFIA